jgi:xanthine dehydrogenase YagS FAD-binding subunit
VKGFGNANARDMRHAASLLHEARAAGRRPAVAGGGSDLLGLVKEQIISPDVIVNLKTIKGLDQVREAADETRIGGLITLDALSRHPLIRERYSVLAEAAESVGTPQIRNVGTLAGNLCQRPWCWYFRNGFPCLKNGGQVCFAVGGENQFHAIFGGGPSHIVHPSDTAPALVALDAKFRLVSPTAERLVPAAEFFTLPARNPARENVLADEEVLAEIVLPPRQANAVSTYDKVLDREAWTHAVVSVAVLIERDDPAAPPVSPPVVVRRARLVLGGVAPVPWALPRVDAMLAGKRLTSDLVAAAAEAALEGAKPLARNGYKVSLTKAVVRRALIALSGL